MVMNHTSSFSSAERRWRPSLALTLSFSLSLSPPSSLYKQHILLFVSPFSLHSVPSPFLRNLRPTAYGLVIMFSDKLHLYLYLTHGAIAEFVAFFRTLLRTVLWSLFEFEPVAGEDRIHIGWLTTTLRKQGRIHPSTRVVSTKLSEHEGNRGLAGDMRKVLLTYTFSSDSAEREYENPLSLMLKTSRTGRSQRASNLHSGQYREGLFYSSSFVNHFRLPYVVYSKGSSSLGELVVLMEDLKHTGEKTNDAVVGANIVMGNQVWGVPEKKYWKERDVDVLESMYIDAARVHAATWCSPELLSEENTWLKGVPWYHGYNRKEWERGVAVSAGAWQMFKWKVDNGGVKGISLSPYIRSLFDRTFNDASWEQLQTYLSNTKTHPYALCHGDFHAGNALLHTNTGGLTWVDMSEVGVWNPAVDLAQTLISDAKPNIIKQHAHRLISLYLNSLKENGISGVDEKSFFKEFYLGGLEKWAFIFPLLSLMLPPHAVQYFHDQIEVFLNLEDDPPKTLLLKSVVPLLGV